MIREQIKAIEAGQGVQVQIEGLLNEVLNLVSTQLPLWEVCTKYLDVPEEVLSDLK